jgi:serine/threonine protein kinase/tetratricopeptide (TPR) repeat protein
MNRDTGTPGQGSDGPTLQAAGAGTPPQVTAPLSPGAGRSTPGPAPEAAGTQIGPYRILDLLGEGGFGAVYAAEQREPVRRRVALKVVKLGMDSREVIARFEAERQALALMDHPNVAKVFDAGLTDRGRPYFAMEFVQGVSITHYCDEHNLSTRERLRLFIDVCLAVQHAHQKGIIHRDLKPGNILVTLLDGKPVPKVIDFGIAKATNHQLSAQTIYTETGRLMGTPEYMAPEQAGTSGLDVDTRADVYSLGVILYELLTGTLPIEASRLRAQGYEGIGRVLREVEPAKPSTRLTEPRGRRASPTRLRAQARERLPESVAEIARHRHTDPASLRSQLKGDLDWITLKALEKDRTRRYDTAVALAQDIERHLNHEPVLARPPSASYRMAKFVRRHRLGVAAAAMVTLALIAGIVGTTLGMVRAIEAEAVARANEAKARAVNRFLRDMLEAGDVNNRGLNRTLGDLLDETVRKLNAGTAPAHPEVDAEVRMTIGNAYLSQRAGDLALPLVTEALRVRRSLARGDTAAVAESMNDVGLALHYQGKLDEAERWYAESLAMRRRVCGEPSKDVVDSLNNLAGLRYSQRRFAEAEALHREALAMRRALFGPEHEDVAQSLNNLALALKEQGVAGDAAKAEEAERTFRLAIDMRRRVAGPDNPRTATSLNNLATLLRDLKRPAEAEPLQREALAIRRAQLPPGHVDTINAQLSLASILTDLNKGEEAERLLREVLATVEAQPSTAATTIAGLRSMIGAALGAQGKFEEGERLVLESFESVRDNPRLSWDRRRIFIERIVRLYEAWGKQDKAAQWRSRLEPNG